MKNQIKLSVMQAIEAAKRLAKDDALQFIEDVAKAIVHCFQNEGKLLIAGNGGSLCDAAHFAEELTGFFRKKRKPLPAIALSEPGHMSAVSNDHGFQYVFSRYVESLGQKNDLLIVLTTSGNSQNLIEAVEAAEKKQLKTIAFLGKEGGQLKGRCNYEWIVKGFQTSDRIQEAHMAAIHILIEMVERKLFGVNQENEDAQALASTY